jgi:[protein-PII] uridylyltransferase
VPSLHPTAVASENAALPTEDPRSGRFVIAQDASEFERTFLASMPEDYKLAWDAEAMVEHARIARDRAGAAAHVALFRTLPEGAAVICMIADDRPGLLALISAALVVNKLDVTGAEAYCRERPDGVSEAVDLIWVRRAGRQASSRPIAAKEVTRVAEVLRGLVEGSIDVEEASRQAADKQKAHESRATSVHFLDRPQDGLAVLAVDTEDRPGLLLAISRSLFQQRVQIARSLVATEEGRVTDRFLVAEFDGAPIAARRRGQIEAAVLYAIQALPGEKG